MINNSLHLFINDLSVQREKYKDSIGDEPEIINSGIVNDYGREYIWMELSSKNLVKSCQLYEIQVTVRENNHERKK